MTLYLRMEVIARTRPGGAAEVVFVPLRGEQPLRDLHGAVRRFGFPLDRPDDDLADLLRAFAKWVADLFCEEAHEQRRAVHRAATKK